MPASSPVHPPARRTSWGTLFAWIVCIGLSTAGFRNALAPAPELEGQARTVACAASATAAAPAAATPSSRMHAAPASARALQSTLWESGPLGRAFGFEDPRAGLRLRVQCRREYIALGDYQCLRVP